MCPYHPGTNTNGKDHGVSLYAEWCYGAKRRRTVQHRRANFCRCGGWLRSVITTAFLEGKILMGEEGGIFYVPFLCLKFNYGSNT